MAEATLTDVIQQLRLNSKQNTDENSNISQISESMLKRIDRIMDFLLQGRLDDIERDREKKRKDTPTPQIRPKKDDDDSGFGGLLRGMLSLGGLLAAIPATIAVLEGLGPSLKDLQKAFRRFGKLLRAPLIPIEKLLGKSFKGIDEAIRNRYAKLRTRILKAFGLDPNLQARDPKTGRFMPGKMPISQQIAQKFKTLRLNILKSFGIGADGKMPAMPKTQMSLPQKVIQGLAKFSKGVTPFLDDISKFIRPVRNFIAGISAFVTGTGAKFVDLTAKIVKGTGIPAILGKIVRFIRPIALIFSAFAGLSEAQKDMKKIEEEGGGDIEKFIEGGIGGFTAGFLGDFFGGFLDIIKNAPLQLLKLVFPGMVGEDGKFKEDSAGGFGKILNNILDFSFEDKIKEMVKAPFRFLGEFIENALNFFFPESRGITDEEKKAAQSYFDGFLDLTDPESGASKLLDAIFAPVNFFIDMLGGPLLGDSDIMKQETFTGKIRAAVDAIGKFLSDLIPTAEQIQTFVIETLSGNKLGRATLDILSAMGVVDEKIADIGKISGRITGLQEELGGRTALSPEDMAALESDIAKASKRANILAYKRGLTEEERAEKDALSKGLASMKDLRNQQKEISDLQAEIAQLKAEKEVAVNTIVSNSPSKTDIKNKTTVLPSDGAPESSDPGAPGYAN